MKNVYPDCPHCETKTLKLCLSTLHSDKAISYYCRKCKQEFYVCVGEELLTHKEFIKRKNDWNG